jgi:hypothetical protein
LLILSALAFCLCGCGLIERAGTLVSIGHEGASKVEPPPTLNPELREKAQEQIAYASDVLSFICGRGVAAGNAVVRQAGDGLDFALSTFGPPEHKIPLEVKAEAMAVSAKANTSRAEGEELLARQRALEDKYRARQEAASREPSVSRWWISSPYLVWGTIGGLALSLLGAIGWALSATVKAKSTGEALFRVFLGIKDFIGGDPAKVTDGTPQAGLLDALSRKMDRNHKELIEALYKRVGD